MTWRFWRPAHEPCRDPNIPCKYCTGEHKWRMDMHKHVIYVCGLHVDLALDEYLERKNGKVSAD